MSKYERPVIQQVTRSDGQIVTIIGGIEWNPAGITPPNIRRQNIYIDNLPGPRGMNSPTHHLSIEKVQEMIEKEHQVTNLKEQNEKSE